MMSAGRDNRFSVANSLLLRFKDATARLFCAGRTVTEPPGQDGYSCQALALLDQLSDAGLAHLLPPGYDKMQLRADSRRWLSEHGDIVLDYDLGAPGALALLRD